jgi:hypothetical protein
MTPTTHYALRSIKHNGVKVYYTVDFRKKQVSIVDHEGNSSSFVFTNREIKYHQGWHDILDAIRHAMDTGFAEIEVYQTEQDKILTDKLISMSEFSDDNDDE